MVSRGQIVKDLCGYWTSTSTKAVLRAWVLGHGEENQFQESS